MQISDQMRKLIELARKIVRRRKAKEETDKLIAAIKAQIRTPKDST